MSKTIDIILSGDKFKPSSLCLETKILAEYGSISKRGRYKGKPSPYGLAYMIIPLDSLTETLDNLVSNINDLKQSGVSDVELDSVFWDDEKSDFLNYKKSEKVTKLLNKINSILNGNS